MSIFFYVKGHFADLVKLTDLLATQNNIKTLNLISASHPSHILAEYRNTRIRQNIQKRQLRDTYSSSRYIFSLQNNKYQKFTSNICCKQNT